MKKKLLIDIHYLPSIEYIALLTRYDTVIFEMMENFQKQTFRNRCYLLGANKVLPLVIPVLKDKDRRIDKLKIDYKQTWLKDHWRAIESSYNKSPFFLHYKEDLKTIFDSKPERLVDLNLKLLTFCLMKLDYNISFNLTTTYNNIVDSEIIEDFRGLIDAKSDYETRSIINPQTYFQMFGKTFVPNLSILDLLFCEGPYSRAIIEASFRSVNN